MVRVNDVSSKIAARARDVGFTQSSELAVGHLLGALAATKPGGRFLELGTGAGLGTAHILAGMSATASLITVEVDPVLSQIARDETADARVEFVVADAGCWLESRLSAAGSYDLIFADAWPGKFDQLDEALGLVAAGGMYVVDDLLPQPNWPPEHEPRVEALTTRLAAMAGWRTATLGDASGVMICSKCG